MSPEQAEGRKLDARTGIFSFGVVLYETLAGHQAFTGGSQIAIMTAILKEEPKPIDGIPAQLEWLLRRCLRKDREKRFQHMDDLRLVPEEIGEDSQAGHPAPAAANIAEPPQSHPARAGRGWLLPLDCYWAPRSPSLAGVVPPLPPPHRTAFARSPPTPDSPPRPQFHRTAA